MKDQSVRVGLYRRVSKDAPEGGPYKFYQLKDEDPLFTRPTLLCCGGIYINKEHLDPKTHEPDGEKSANGFAKIAHSMLGFRDYVKPDDPIDIVSVVYPGSAGDLDEIAEKLNDNTFRRKTHYSKAADNLVYDRIKPLLVDQNGQAKDIEQIKKSLRNIHILAHSYGGTFVRDVGNALYAVLTELGLDKDEIREATSQVLVVAAGSTAPIGAGKASFTSVDIVNSRDDISGGRYPDEHPQSEMIKSVFKRNKRPDNPLTVMPIRLSLAGDPQLKYVPESRQCLVYASVTGEAAVRSNECGFLYNPNTNETPPLSADETNHQVETYFNFGTTPNGFMMRTIASSTLANALNNAIDNSKRKKAFTDLPAPMDLMQCPKKFSYPLAIDEYQTAMGGKENAHRTPRDFTRIAKMIGYDERINAACGRASIAKG